MTEAKPRDAAASVPPEALHERAQALRARRDALEGYL
jgi:hypothetical protein